MKNYYRKRINVAFKAILFLCLIAVVFSGFAQQRAKMVVYIGDKYRCIDTLVIEDIDLRAKRIGTGIGFGYSTDARSGRILQSGTDDTLEFLGRPVTELWWLKNGEIGGPVSVDTVALRRFNNILESFEESPVCCLNRKFDANLCSQKGQLKFYSDGTCTVNITTSHGAHVAGKGTYNIVHGVKTTIIVSESTCYPGEHCIKITPGAPYYLHAIKYGDGDVSMDQVYYKPCCN